ncbi:ATP-binding cassette domain-containing protein, partial [Achromobacter xylosoxidans]
MNAAPALRLENVASGYKGAVVLNDISLSVAGGACVALLGKNGMGKSTLLKTVMGYLPKLRGTVSLGGVDATRLRPHEVARRGVAYAAQDQPLFPDLNIRDNLRLGLPNDRLFEERFDEIADLFPVFASRLRQHAGTLSGGE